MRGRRPRRCVSARSRNASDLPAFAITDNLLGKHFAVLGTTGAGKSCAVTVILRAILDAHPFGHVIMLDPHNEYACGVRHTGRAAQPEQPEAALLAAELRGDRGDPGQPGFARPGLRRGRDPAARDPPGAPRLFGAEGNTDHVTVDTPVPYRLSELVQILNDDMGAFNKPESAAPYQHLINRIEASAPTSATTSCSRA